LSTTGVDGDMADWARFFVYVFLKFYS